MRRDLGDKTSRGEVIQKEKRPCPLYQDVVDTVVDEIDAHSAMLVGEKGNLQLGADAVSARYEDGIFPSGRIETIEPAERSDLREDARCERGLRQRFYAADRLVAGV